MSEYANKCVGIQNIWNSYTNNEVFGYITMDDKLIVTNVLPFIGGSASGLYLFNNIYYYPYPDSQGSLNETYAGIIHSAGNYFIPIKASLHTHTPCRLDGTDGVSHPVGADDISTATRYPGINHWVVGCNAIAQFDANGVFFNVQSGSLVVNCNKVY